MKLTGEEFARLVKEIGAASRRGRSVFRFSGVDAECRAEGGRHVPAPPEKLTLAVTAYTLTVTPVLKQKLETGAFRRTGPMGRRGRPRPYAKTEGIPQG